MKCPKCSNEYEGLSCLHCNGPKIIINDNDYLRRKKEWEEKGTILGVKVKKGTSTNENKVGDAKPSKVIDGQKVNINIKKVKKVIIEKINEKFKAGKKSIKKVNVKATSKVSKNKSNNKSNSKSNSKSNNNNKNKSSNKNKSNNINKENENKTILKKYIKKNWLQISLIAVTLIIVIIAVSGIYGLYKRFSMTMYIVGDDGRIVTGGFEDRLVNNVSEVIFTMEGESFYEVELPSEFADKTIMYSYASSGGDYFVTELYDNREIYTLYIWNKNGIKKIIEGSNEKELKYVSDNGKVIFTDITYLFEGAVNNIALYVFDVSGSSDKNKEKGLLTLIEQNIRSQYIYLKNKTLVYLNSLNQLYTINFSKFTDKVIVAENISVIYGVSADTDNLYSNSTAIVKPSDKDESLIYSKNGEYFHYDIDDKETTYLFNSSYMGVEIVYEKSLGNVYCIGMNSISFGTIKEDKGAILSNLDNIKSSNDKCYFPKSSKLLYVTRDGQLISVKKGNKTLIRGGISSNSLSLVRNSTGITYIADGNQYFRSSISASEIKLQALEDGSYTSQTLEHNGYIYFMSAKGELSSCSLKGKDFNSFGTITSFWVK